MYERETYFREAFADAGEIFTTAESFQAFVHRSALLMLKPDGLFAGKLGVVHRFLGEHGFTVAAVREVRFTRLLWRELWRFQLTSATLDRLAVNECVLTDRTALLLALRTDGAHELPGTVRLSSLKGSATLSAQAPGSLRSLLGQPNRVLSFIHVADEPADLIRELGLLLEPPERRTVLSALADGVPSAEDSALLAAALQRDAMGGRSLDAAAAIERVTEAVRQTGDGGPAAARALDVLSRMRSGDRVAWLAFVRDLTALDAKVDRWDLAMLGTSFIVYDEPGASKLIGNPERDAWLRPLS